MGEPGWTAGAWEYVPGTEHHGPYVSALGGDVADCYCMSDPLAASVRNGGTSFPINHRGADAEANARLIAAAPALYAALIEVSDMLLARPDMVAKLRPLMGPAEHAIFERARAALASAVSHG